MPALIHCIAHPRYRALRRPSCFCDACWWLWLLRTTRLTSPAGVKR